MPPAPPKILFLAPILEDAAAARRLRMLRQGEAEVRVAGFHRGSTPVKTLGGLAVTDWGRTVNGGFRQRTEMVLKTALRLRRYRQLFDVDIVIARNLEMLALAVLGGRRRKPVIIYEVLDIHRLLLGEGPLSLALRAVERFLVRRAKAITTSSPAFVEHYLSRWSSTIPVRLVENKLLLHACPPAVPARLDSKPPWVIGWFGILRCRKSLEILRRLVMRSGGQVKVILRGKPALDQIPEFHDLVAATPNMEFKGAYQNPYDLARIYSEIHFAWAIDFFDEGSNSDWLLPNRLYESGYYRVVPLARHGVETSRYLQDIGIGVLFPDPLSESLENFFANLAPATYAKYADALRELRPSQWVYTDNDCRNFIRFLEDLTGKHPVL